MSTERLTENETTQVSEETNQAPQLSEVEQQAAAKGWRPKEEWTDLEKDWVPADEFMRREPIFEKMRALKNTVHSQDKMIKQMAQQYDKLGKMMYERARAELMAQKKEALIEGDVDKILDIDNQLDDLKQDSGPDIQQQQLAEQQRIFSDWVSENDWFEKNEDMRAYAEGYGLQLRQRNPTLNYGEFLENVTKKTKQHFQSAKRTAPAVDTGSVEGRASTESRGKTKGIRENDLSDDERRIMNVLLRANPKLTKEKYLADLTAAYGGKR